MNYFAHGIRFVDQPYFLAGTAVPDWLNVADRGLRLRPQHVEPLADASQHPIAELAAGILQHFQDDRLFHKSRAFVETSGDMTRLFRGVLGAEDGFRPGFLGHIVTELLLDDVLIEAHPGRLDAYYEAIDRVDPAAVEAGVNQMSRNSTARLAEFIPLFRREEFLRDYHHPERLLFRLNQVMRRVRLNQLPEEVIEVLIAGRAIVESRWEMLLPF